MSQYPRTLFHAKTIAIILALLIGLFSFLDWLVDYLWFDSIQYTEVFWRLRLLRIGIFAVVFLAVYLVLWLNLKILSARLDLNAVANALLVRIATPSGMTSPVAASPSTGRARTGRHSGIPSALLWLAAVIAFGFGMVLASQWDTMLRFLWCQTYGELDPIYGKDIGFYLFELPALELLQNTLAALAFIGAALLLATYGASGVLRISWHHGVAAPPTVFWHLAVHVALFFAAGAWGYYLDRYALLQSPDGIVYGAGYTEVNVLRPALAVAVASTLCLAIGVWFAPLWRRGKAAVIVLSAYLIILVLALLLIPWSIQRFQVEPNELQREQPFLRHNIAFTRKAYQLHQIEERAYSANHAVSLSDLADDESTVDNIRLWDWDPLSETFRQLQRIRTYYQFHGVDIDRYRVNNRVRQVMLSARELTDDLPTKAETWLNQHLQYTHGFGLAMSLAAEKTVEGTPVMIIKDLPPRTRGGLSITQPAIYYGEHTSGYRIVTTAIKEFDYPKGDENAYTHYDGHGGVLLDTVLKKLLFAWHQGDLNILLSSYTLPGSRIQLWRQVRERVQRIAPFLSIDEDPYLVLSGGRLYWIVDAYTVSSSFPYSEPYQNRFNYIRNSVKIVVDAYHGSVNLFVIEPDDPVLDVYQAALPGVFQPLEALEPDLRRHLRYPQDLFAVQLALYSTYHMQVPQVFYNTEDLWARPWEKYGGEEIRMKPYYVLMKLPGEKQLQFLLMSPLTPSERDNMIAWVAARCDYPNYGELVAYKLPKERLILGPSQIEAMIDQDTLISQQLSLWDQRGSRVLRGNLLVIPIDNSFIYVEPVYLIAEGTEIPQLKRVIISDGRTLAMELTLEDALKAVFGMRNPQRAPSRPGKKTEAFYAAQTTFKQAEQAFRTGDWEAFGRAMQSLKELLLSKER
jgi:uncharacterized membrane protein (UPF0182 family)